METFQEESERLRKELDAMASSVAILKGERTELYLELNTANTLLRDVHQRAMFYFGEDDSVTKRLVAHFKKDISP